MINLLPQEAQHQLRADQFHRALMAFGFFIMAIFSIGFVMLFPLFIALRYLTQDLSYAREVEERSPSSRALEERTRTLTALELRARGILAFAAKSSSFEDILQEIFRVAPVGIDLLTVQFEKNMFTIEGHYQRRSLFLSFLEALKTSTLIKNVSSPLSNLLKETDSSFHITLSL